MKRSATGFFSIFFVALITFSACGEKGTFNNNGDYCDGYGDPAESNYILPYQTGESYFIGQGNCGQVTHVAQGRFAYDFAMPSGTQILAARSGVVHEVVESRRDYAGHAWLETNYVYIIHPDGSMGAYVHIQENGALVDPGDTVTQGQPIAISGSSGTDIPHLHFQVYSTKDSWRTIPVNFRNQGVSVYSLREGDSYTAGAFTPDNN